jgi:acetate kinase
MRPVYLVLNAGSSSLKFQVFDAGGSGRLNRIYRGVYAGLKGAPHFLVTDVGGEVVAEQSWHDTDRFGHTEALDHLASWLGEHRHDYRLEAVGHRVVHGGTNHSDAALVDKQLVEELERLIPLAPLHQPHNLEPIRILCDIRPNLPQVASFDTAFHRSQPEIAQLYALPRRMIDAGVRRYGFHGLSYAYVASVLPRIDVALAGGRVIVAHLGNGASMCALSNGLSVATTMGFSALEGLPMGTRSGSIDAGIVFYMLREMKIGIEEAERVLYTEAGLLGVSGVSNDMRMLRTVADTKPGAREAIDLFVYRIVREAGSLIAALGGIDGFVFTAGIGENDAETRAEVLRGLAWAGFVLDEAANASGHNRITTGGGPTAWVVPTDEELMIAKDMQSILDDGRQPRTSYEMQGVLSK